MKRYFLAGREISPKEKDDILWGRHEKKIYCARGQEGIPEFWISDVINTVGNDLDRNDSLLKIIEEKFNIEETLIVLASSKDPLGQPRGAVYICK